MQKTCNACEHLSLTEGEQNMVRRRGEAVPPHICTKYNKRVTHYPYNHPFIHPCEECEKGGEG